MRRLSHTEPSPRNWGNPSRTESERHSDDSAMTRKSAWMWNAIEPCQVAWSSDGAPQLCPLVISPSRLRDWPKHAHKRAVRAVLGGGFGSGEGSRGERSIEAHYVASVEQSLFLCPTPEGRAPTKLSVSNPPSATTSHSWTRLTSRQVISFHGLWSTLSLKRGLSWYSPMKRTSQGGIASESSRLPLLPSSTKQWTLWRLLRTERKHFPR